MTRKRKRTVTVHNTTGGPVVYNSAGQSLAGGATATNADPTDPKTAALIEKRTLHVKEN